MITVTTVTSPAHPHTRRGLVRLVHLVHLRMRLARLMTGGGRLSGRLNGRLRGRARDERGVATVWVVLLATALLAMAGLVIDGGYALGAKREATNQAEQAARAGADALNEGSLRSGGSAVRVDPGRAVAAAQTYLRQVGARGRVSVDGDEVTVTVTARQDTTILSAVGVDSLPVEATATALSIDEDDG